MSDFNPVFGWLDRPADVEATLKTMEMPILTGSISKALIEADLGNDVFAFDYERKILGSDLPPPDQGNIGSCVGFGGGGAAQDTILLQCELNGVAWPGAPVCREGVYALSRCEYGNMCDNSDGSVGAWCAKAVEKGGLLFYQKYPSIDLTGGYSVSRCKQWGGRGMPDDLEPTARQRAIKVVTLVDTWEKAWAALGSGYFINICGNISRTTKRQKNGICPQTGNNWAHSQRLRGRCTVKGGQRCFVYGNSWGDYLGSENADVQLESGRTVTLPPGCYLAPVEDVHKDLKQGDSFLYSSVEGLTPRNLSWRDW